MSAITANAVIKAVAVAYDVPQADIRGRSKKGHIVEARQIAMYIMRERYGMTYEACAVAVKKRCHGTAMHAYETVWHRLRVEPALRLRYETVLMEIEKGGVR